LNIEMESGRKKGVEVMAAERSEEGLGRIVRIYVMDQEQLCSGIGEDYSTCSWPVCVKAHPEVTKEELRGYLRRMADGLDEHFHYHEIDQDRTTYPDVAT
jgi:hypothetical protein